MGTELDEAQFAEQLRTFERSAFRLELQRVYLEPVEHDTVSKFYAGQPEPPTEVGYLRDWFAQVGTFTAHGKSMGRVRVQEDPPTPYQQWERWIESWNIAAGEQIGYMTRQAAHEIGLLPAAGDSDWWLLDGDRLIVMRYDTEGHRIHSELVRNHETVIQACAWRDLAVLHSAPLTGSTAA